MTRVFFFLFAVTVLAAGAAWLADRPGDVMLNWQGWRIETSVAVLIVALVVLVLVIMALWTALRVILGGPSALAGYFRSRRREKGFQALSRGMIAAGAGDQKLARRHAAEARKLMAGEPLTLLLQAQAAQLAGDRKAALNAFEAMLEDPDTEMLGLRGLYIEAERAGDDVTARLYAERAAERASGLPWAANALLEFHTREGDWEAALDRVERNSSSRLFDKKQTNRARAVLLTAQAIEREESDPDDALERALEAHRLAPELVPAAAVAGRLLAGEGNTRQAARVLEKTWRLSPHPEIAEVFLHARPGDSARDRMKRAQTLAAKLPSEPESRVALAVAAIDAHDWTAAREALAPLVRDGATRRICLLMAEIEDGEHGDTGRVREWLARALRAPRDMAWVADGAVSAEWAPVSPVTGRLDAFEWTTPPDAITANSPAIDHSIRDENEASAPKMKVIESEPAHEDVADAEQPAVTSPEDTRKSTAQDEKADMTAASGRKGSGSGQQTMRSSAPVAAAGPVTETAPPAGAGRGEETEIVDVTADAMPRPPDDPGPGPEEDAAEPAPRGYA
jgi:HemY protein